MQFKGAFLLKASHTLAQPRTLRELAADFQHGAAGSCVPKSLLVSLSHHEAFLVIHFIGLSGICACSASGFFNTTNCEREVLFF